jgi:radical SAM protein with 4Fe4S-binding SPASM domain
VVPCIVVMDEVLDSLPAYVDFVADLGVERIIFQKLYPHTRELRARDPWHLRDHGAIDDRLAQVIERANERAIHVETNLRQLFQHPENRRAAPSPFDILQDNVGIVDMFHPGFCMSTATQATIEWDGTVLPCIKDHISLGTYERSGFDALWNGAEMCSLRASFFARALRPHCRLCWDFYLEHP